MQCPRCDGKLQNILEYIAEREDGFIYTKDFYCSKCKSSIVEHFNKDGLFSSEWIDFNV